MDLEIVRRGGLVLFCDYVVSITIMVISLVQLTTFFYDNHVFFSRLYFTYCFLLVEVNRGYESVTFLYSSFGKYQYSFFHVYCVGNIIFFWF